MVDRRTVPPGHDEHDDDYDTTRRRRGSKSPKEIKSARSTSEVMSVKKTAQLEPAHRRLVKGGPHHTLKAHARVAGARQKRPSRDSTGHGDWQCADNFWDAHA